VYFSKPAGSFKKFTRLSGTLRIDNVEKDTVNFRRVTEGATQKTSLGEYKITKVANSANGTDIAVRFPLPRSLRKDIASRPRDRDGMMKQMQARHKLAGLIRPVFIGSDEVQHRPQGTGSHGSGYNKETTTKKTFGNFTSSKTTSFGSSQIPNTTEVNYHFTKLPPNVDISSIRIEVLELPSGSREVPFELTSIPLR